MTAKKNDGRIVLISGGSRGLGLSLSEKLLSQGYRVVGFSRKKSKEVEKLTRANKNNYWFFEADLSDHDQLKALVKRVETEIGPLFGLVHNGGVVDEALLVRQDEEVISRIISVNLMGGLWLSRLVLRGMLQRSAGRIVNISSIVSVRGYAGVAAYSASKGGLDAMTRSLAREVGRRSITVNSVAPGYMETDLVGDWSEQQLNRQVKRTPLRRLGTVDDVSGAIAFFLSDDAAFITGQRLVVDGGMTC
ncbi:MAG: SDR family oxidoreductase [Rhodospirillales bacterium]|nr:SDR family oxidoreductase [Rhodospirillales bacterium]